MYFSPPHIVCDNNFLTNQGSVHFSYSVVSSSLRSRGLQHTRTPSPSPTPRFLRLVSVESVMLSSVSSSVMPFSSHHQSFPASRSFQISQFFSSGGQTIGVSGSASVLPVNIQDWFPLGWTSLISLLSKGLSRTFSNTTVQKHQFFGTHPAFFIVQLSHPYMSTGKTIALAP